MSFLKKIFKSSESTDSQPRSSRPSLNPTQEAGSSKGAVIEAIQNLRDQEAILNKRKQVYEDQVEELRQKAKELAHTKRQQALACLRKKAILEGSIKNLEQQIQCNFEKQLMLEDRIGMHSTVRLQEEQVRVMKLQKVDISQLDKLNDDYQELYQNQMDVQGMLSTQLGAAEMDDEQIMREYEAMGAEHARTEASALPAAQVPSLPSVPQAQAKSREEKELEDLAQEQPLAA